MSDFAVYGGLAVLAGAAWIALRRWKLGIINERGLEIGAAFASLLLAVLAVKSLF